MTQFSFEVPIAHLKDFDEDQDFIFSLSFLVLSSQKYRTYVLQQESKRVWLDNSFNEKMRADDTVELLHAYTLVLPGKVISPDSPNMSTSEILFLWRKTKQELTLTSNECVVVCSSFEMYKTLLRHQATEFAVSYWTREQIKEKEGEKAFWLKDCHFLGLLNPNELKEFKPQSCDTSMPIKLAMLGQDLGDWASNGYPHINTKDLGKWGGDFFNAILNEDTLRLAKENIRQLKEEVNGQGTK